MAVTTITSYYNYYYYYYYYDYCYYYYCRDHSTWYTVCPNDPISHIQWVSIQQLLYCITDDPSL